MKSLFKISLRYVLTAALITIFVLCVNLALLVAAVHWLGVNLERVEISRDRMAGIEREMQSAENRYKLSDDGYTLLQESGCLWAMRLNSRGEVVWEHQLPGEIPRQYGLGDVAAFSRWYLEDYPVFVWRSGEELMVYGMPKELVRFDLYGDRRVYQWLARFLVGAAALNLLLIAGLAVFFGIRFYQSLRPVASGIERLSRKEPTTLSEKGMTGELARQLNQTSAILRTQDEQLKRRDQARTDWIAGVSHDVRTPLALIMGESDELARAWQDESLRKRAEMIRGQSLVIEQLISDLNLTVKLEYHSQPLRIESVRLAELLRESIAEIYDQGAAEGCRIIPVIAGEGEGIAIDADRQLLLRAFRNLIGNSVHHNPGGCLVQVRLWKEGESICLLFSDDGPGIPPVVAETLEETGEGRPGIHIMGLRIVKQIVEAHGGRMSFAQKETEGRDVQLTLPVKRFDFQIPSAML